ncbi:unnamed protein product [Sphagnum balticum]
MSNYTVTPNMSLLLPTPGVDPGPDYANNQNTSLDLLDQHDHSFGKGVQITPNGLNINSDLTFLSNNATALRSVRFTPQSMSLTAPADIGCLYESGSNGDLFYNDANGNIIQITESGGVRATSSGIASGTASASFVSGVLVVNANTMTPANIQAGSILLGLNVSGTNYLTLSPPASLASTGSYSLYLPALPSQLLPLGLDASGNIQTITGDTSVTGITYVGANLVANTRTRTVAQTVGIGGVALSPSSGAFNASSATNPTNLNVNITTSGRPVFVGCVPDGGVGGVISGIPNPSGFSVIGSSARLNIQIQNTTTGAIYSFPIEVDGSTEAVLPASIVSVVDFPAAGANEYVIYTYLSSGSSYNVYFMKLIAYEL